jgi:hypothetical protein
MFRWLPGWLGWGERRWQQYRPRCVCVCVCVSFHPPSSKTRRCDRFWEYVLSGDLQVCICSLKHSQRGAAVLSPALHFFELRMSLLGLRTEMWDGPGLFPCLQKLQYKGLPKVCVSVFAAGIIDARSHSSRPCDIRLTSCWLRKVVCDRSQSKCCSMEMYSQTLSFLVPSQNRLTRCVCDPRETSKYESHVLQSEKMFIDSGH